MEYIHPYILYVAIAAVCEEKTEIVETIKVFFFLPSVQSFLDVIYLADEYLTFLNLACKKKKIRSACMCVFVQVEDSHMIICDTSESLPPLPLLFVHSASLHGAGYIACIPTASRVMQHSSS